MEFVFENEDNKMSGASKLPTDIPNFFNPSQKAKPSNGGVAKRRSVATSISDIEFSEPVKPKRRRAKAGPKVNYVKSVKKRRKTAKKFEWTWMKVGWLICGLLLLRLVFMNRGIVDFYSMETTLETKVQDLESLRLENVDLTREINKIKSSPKYQRKLAREHLGVIAKDEYLILFARDSRFQSI